MPSVHGNGTDRHGDVTSGQSATALRRRCNRMFSLLHRTYDWAGGSAAEPAHSCAAPSISARQASRCLRQAAERRGRPSRVVFVGDSRNRVVYQHLQQRLGLRDVLCAPETAAAAGAAPSPWQGKPFPCPVSPYEQPYPAVCLEVLQPKNISIPDKLHCTLHAHDAHVRAEFWWRNHIDTAFEERLRALRAECATPLGCADLVVLDGGMWYAGRKLWRNARSTRHVAALRFREELARLEPALAALAASTGVVWKLDEAVSEMFSKTVEQGAFNVLHAMLHEMQARVPNLVIWSSMMPESNNFLQNVCLQLAKLEEMYIAFRGECHDITHVGTTLRAYYSNHIVNYLCQGTPELRKFGSCCN